MDPASAPKLPFLLPLAVFLSISFPLSNGSLHVYNHETFREVGNSFLLAGGSEGVFAPRSPSSPSLAAANSSSSHHDARSYIRFQNITFWRDKEAYDGHTDKEGSSGLVQVVIFEAADRDDIGGSAYGGQRSICCTADLAKLEGCKQGEVIKTRSSTDDKWPMVLNVNFHGDSLSAEMDNTEVHVSKTGIYNLFFISCDAKMKGLAMDGMTLWKNPDGYLPRRMAPLMNFSVSMALAYVLHSLIWFFQYFWFWKDILQVQHCITLLVGLSWLEMTLWYLEYAHFKSSEVRPVVITTWVVTTGALRKSVSQILLFCISVGYGVVSPTLGVLPPRWFFLESLTFWQQSFLISLRVCRNS